MADLSGVFGEQGFDANSVEPSAPREILPPGEYLSQAIKSSMKDTKAGTGKILEIEFDVISGPYQGRKFWDRLNLKNPNSSAQEIALRTLSAICAAVGIRGIQNSEQLHGKTLLAVLKVRPADGQYAAANEVSGYKPANGNAPAAGYTPPGQPAPQQAATRPAFQTGTQSQPAAQTGEAPPAAANTSKPWLKARA